MNYKRELFQPRADAYHIFSSIKSLGYRRFFKEIQKIKGHPGVRGIIEGNLFPKDVAKLNKDSRIYFSQNLGGELAWLIWSIKKYGNKINQYLLLKEQFERETLLGNYQEALNILDKIETDVCMSFWSIENRFSILEKQEGTEKNWELLNKLNSQAKDDNLVLYYLELFSKKAEAKLSFTRYQRSLNYDLFNVEDSLKDFLYFKFGYFFKESYQHYDSFLIRETNYSIIDRYELVISILFEVISKDHEDNYGIGVNAVKDLNETIEDFRIKRMLEFIGELSLTEDIEPKILEYFEKYSRGKYNECIDAFPNLIKEFPVFFELYEPFIKSLIETDQVLPKLDFSSEISQIAQCLYSIYSYDDDFDFSLENILKKIITFSKLPSFNQLLGLLSFSTLIKSKYRIVDKLTFFNSRFSNPILFLLNEKRIVKGPHPYKSLIFSINNSIISGEYSCEAFKDILPNKKNKIYELRSVIQNKDYNKSLELIEYLLETETLTPYDYNELFNLKYSSFIGQNEINQALLLVANQLLVNKSFCSKIDISSLLNHLVEIELENIPGSLELVIFYHYANATAYLQFVVLDELFMELEIDYPHELLKFLNKENKEKIVYILEQVCNVDVLGNFLVYESRREVVKEREDILVELIALKPDKEDEYISEIARLKRIETVQNVIKEVNDGRIYINIKSLDQSQKGAFENSFERLLNLLEYSKSRTLYFADVNGKIEKLYLSNQEDLMKDAAFLTCKSFINELTNSFLYSKEYGLDGCLSTRIRHGALENNIRGVLDRFGLMSKKTNDVYQRLDYWAINGNHLPLQTNDKIQESLIKFSKKIDELIKFLITEKVQIYSIKSTDKKEGLFHFYFADDFHWLLYNDLKAGNYDYDSFINYVFDVLKSHTSDILTRARDYFKNEVKEQLISFLEELNTNINYNLGNDNFPQLSNNIRSAITQIQNEIDENISEWFKLSEDTYQNLLDFESIIATSVSLTSSSRNSFEPEIFCDKEIGVYGYLHYIFIFRILFDNIIGHSKLESSDTEAKVIVNYDEDIKRMKISVENKLNTKIKKEELDSKLLKVKENWETKSLRQEVVNTEGDSGFEKIKRILTYDLNSQDHSFDYEVNQSKLRIDIILPMTMLKNEKNV